MGTPDFSVPVLQGLIDSTEHEVVAVVTQPDKARGRSGKLTFTPVKELAIANDIPVYTPKRVKDKEFVEVLKNIESDVFVVIAFGQILSKEILDIPKYGCINVHASLLPRWRGSAPIQWAIIEGDKYTGVTTMQMDEGIDTGDILLTKEYEISPNETGESLFEKLSQLGSNVLLETLNMAKKGELKPIKQDEAKSTYAKMLSKSLGQIDWNTSAVQIERYIRGLNSWPSAYTSFRNKTLKLWSARVIDKEFDSEPGTVVEIGKESFTVATKEGALEILEVQLEGKKRMNSGDFLRGVQIEAGETMGI